MEMDIEKAKASYQSLSEQERELIREVMDSPVVIRTLGSFNKPRRKMDAAQRQMAAGMLMR
jgi:hypothetical protein